MCFLSWIFSRAPREKRAVWFFYIMSWKRETLLPQFCQFTSPFRPSYAISVSRCSLWTPLKFNLTKEKQNWQEWKWIQRFRKWGCFLFILTYYWLFDLTWIILFLFVFGNNLEFITKAKAAKKHFTETIATHVLRLSSGKQDCRQPSLLQLGRSGFSHK